MNRTIVRSDFEGSDPVLRFVQASQIEEPPVGRVDSAVPKVPDIPVIECKFMEQRQYGIETQFAPMLCGFVKGNEAPLGTYMNQETGSVITCTGNRNQFLCELRPTYELASYAPGGFVVSLSDKGPAIQTVNITRSVHTIPLHMK